jgi:hypothetical protein
MWHTKLKISSHYLVSDRKKVVLGDLGAKRRPTFKKAQHAVSNDSKFHDSWRNYTINQLWTYGCHRQKGDQLQRRTLVIA